MNTSISLNFICIFWAVFHINRLIQVVLRTFYFLVLLVGRVRRVRGLFNWSIFSLWEKDGIFGSNKILIQYSRCFPPSFKGRSRLDMVVELRVKYCGEIALKIEFALLLNNYTPKKRLKCVLKISSQYCTLSSTAVCYVKPVAFLLSGFIRIISF